MKTLTYKFIILLFSLLCYTLNSNAYNLRQINNKDGLSNSSILSVGQDENHLMLFGTCDGLNIFDGKDIQIFRSTPSNQAIKGNFIEKIITTQPGTYWIRTNSGLNKMNSQKGEFLFFQSLPATTSFSQIVSMTFSYMMESEIYRYSMKRPSNFNLS